MKDFNAATLMAHGFNDWNVMISHSAPFIKVLKGKGVPLQVYFHQGGHGGEPPFAMMNKWFTRYLFGVENNVENDPKAWIVREKDDRSKPTPYADYPNPDALPVEFFLSRVHQKQDLSYLKNQKATNIITREWPDPGTRLTVDLNGTSIKIPVVGGRVAVK